MVIDGDAARADVCATLPATTFSGASANGHAEVYQSDAEALAEHLTARGVAPALIYIDPPFATERTFKTASRAAGESPRVAYVDRWPDFDAYVRWMTDVIEACWRLLRADGSLILHCDHRASPYLAAACDRIFGRGDRGPRPNAPGFRNEIVWSYGLGGSSPRCYPKKHDTLLWYSRGARWTFEAPRVPAQSVRMRGLDKKATDVFDIASINNMAAERTGYPTQKPLELLRRLVCAHTREGDTVVDLFSGSGTTAEAAVVNGRRAMVGDASREAVLTTCRRLQAVAATTTLRAERPQGAQRPNDVAWTWEGAMVGDRLDVSNSADAAAGGTRWRWGRHIDGSEFGGPASADAGAP